MALTAHQIVLPEVAAFRLYLVPFDGTDPVLHGPGNLEPTPTQRDAAIPIVATSTGLSFGGTFDLNGNEIILDADADTSITADTDDQIDFKLNSVDHVVFKAVAAADAGVTRDLVEIAATSAINTTGTNVLNALTIDLEIGNATAGTNTVRAIQIDGVTADAQVTDVAINIGSGWTSAFVFAGDAARSLVLGVGEDIILGHNGTHSLLTSATGNFTIDSTSATGAIILMLGTDTTATKVAVQNNSAADIFSVTPSSASAGTTLVAGVLDLNGTLDQDVALTGTGNAVDIDFTMTHATQVSVGVDVDATQLTNARTGGYLAGFRAKTTSLAGDLNGVPYTGMYVLAPTDGGGAVLHSGMYVEAGNDYSVHGLDGVRTAWGTGAAGVADATMGWDGTILSLLPAVDDSVFKIGNGTLSFDVWMYGNTASDYVLWDASANKLSLEGAASLSGVRLEGATATAITGATVLTLADAGGIWTVSQGAAYDIDLPSPTTGRGCIYRFSLTGPAANNVTITVLGGAATFVGFIQIDGATIVATGATLTYVSGNGSLGDYIEIESLTTGLYHVRAFASTAGGISIG